MKLFRREICRIFGLAAAVAMVSSAGCAGPGPELFPVAPLTVKEFTDGRAERWYDTSGDGRADYRELLSAEGLVVKLGYDTNCDGRIDLDADLGRIPEDECRHLVVVLDSVPFLMVRQLWAQGRFRLFHRPSRVISPFPVMTDPSLSEFFGTSPCPGVESAYYNGQALTDGYQVYVNEGNVAWKRFVDYHMRPIAHVPTYLWPGPWYDHELRRIQETFERSKANKTVAYVVGTSALGARAGRNGHQAGLIRIDRFCQLAMFKARGRVKITLMSDHGHYLEPSQRIRLREVLTRLGYRVRGRLEEPADVVVPEFGMVTCAAIHTRSGRQVAHDVAGVEGIDLTAYLDDRDRVVVVSREGRARITRSSAGFRYERKYGDPLRLGAILDQLENQGRVDPEGFIGDRILFEATESHVYPDAVYRLWRAFHGLIEHTPDVLVSTENGWHCGSPTMSKLITLIGAHGNLKRPGSCGFAMTTAGQLPPVLRMAHLRAALRELGVPLNGPPRTIGQQPGVTLEPSAQTSRIPGTGP